LFVVGILHLLCFHIVIVAILIGIVFPCHGSAQCMFMRTFVTKYEAQTCTISKIQTTEYEYASDCGPTMNYKIYLQMSYVHNSTLKHIDNAKLCNVDSCLEGFSTNCHVTVCTSNSLVDDLFHHHATGSRCPSPIITTNLQSVYSRYPLNGTIRCYTSTSTPKDIVYLEIPDVSQCLHAICFVPFIITCIVVVITTIFTILKFYSCIRSQYKMYWAVKSISEMLKEDYTHFN